MFRCIFSDKYNKHILFCPIIYPPPFHKRSRTIEKEDSWRYESPYQKTTYHTVDSPSSKRHEQHRKYHTDVADSIGVGCLTSQRSRWDEE